MRSLFEINEGTVWGSAIKRSIGKQEERKEDIRVQNPFFGEDRIYKLYHEGEKRLFNWYEVEDILKKNPGWRLVNSEDLRDVIESGNIDNRDKFYFNYKKENGICKIKSRFGELDLPDIGVEEVYKNGSVKKRNDINVVWMSNKYCGKFGAKYWSLCCGYGAADCLECDDYDRNHRYQLILIESDGINEGTVWGGAIKRSLGQQGMRKENYGEICNGEICSWLEELGLTDDDYEITNDWKIDVLKKDFSLIINDSNLVDDKLPDYIKFRKISCGLDLSFTELKSCVGFPEEIDGDFRLTFCDELESLEGCPKKVGGDFLINFCKNLTSLKGCPEEIGGDFWFQGNENLNDFSDFPKRIGNDIKYSKYSEKFFDIDKYRDRWKNSHVEK